MSSDQQEDTPDSVHGKNRPKNQEEIEPDDDSDTDSFEIEYLMNRRQRGMCLIFNHENFGQLADPRIGTDIDAKALNDCFTHHGFDVTEYKDKTVQDVKTLLKAASMADHSDNNCFVCCFLTHGGKDVLYASDGTYSRQDVLELFTGDKCRKLSSKPKIFIMQACRGRKTDGGSTICIPDASLGPDNSIKTATIPIWSDFLIANSTMDGFLSYRQPNKGGPFIKYLAFLIEKYAHKYDLVSILTQVNDKISKYNAKSKGEQIGKQMPQFYSTLTAKLFFRKLEYNDMNSISSYQEYSDNSFESTDPSNMPEE